MGEVVLITGCSSGIGKALALEFLNNNFKVVATARKKEDLLDLEEKGCQIEQLDVVNNDDQFRVVEQVLKIFGKIELATVVWKKDWIKYGVHMLEALFALFDDPKAVSVKNISKSGKDIVFIEFETGLLATVHLFYDIVGTFQISVFGSEKWRLIEIENSYSMFRDNLNEFVKSLQQGKVRLEFKRTENIIRALIAGKDSLKNNGQTIKL